MQDRASLAAGGADIPSDRAAVEHALNRLTFGPRPGQVERGAAAGPGALDRSAAEPGVDRRQRRAVAPDAASRLLPAVDRRAARNLSEQERMEMQRRARQASRQSVQALAAPEDHPRGLQRAAARRSARRLLVQPLQRLRRQGTHGGSTSPSTSARRSARTSWAASASCSAPRRRARRCSSISTTG